MSGPELLNLSDSNPQDVFFRQPSFKMAGGRPNTPFHYDTWSSITNFAHRIRPIRPYNSLQAPGYGTSELIFRIDASAWLRGPMQLHVTRSALSFGAGATFARFVDWEGYAMIEYVKLIYGPNLCYEINGDELHIRTKLQTPFSRKEAVKELVHGDKTDVQRDALAATAQDLFIDLPLPFTVSPKTFFMGAATSHPLELHVKFRPLADITQTDGTGYPTGSITSVTIKSFDVFVNSDERQYGEMVAKSGRGITYRIMEMEHQQNLVDAGSANYVVALTALRGSASETILTVRNQADVISTSTPTATKSRTNYLEVANWEIRTGNSQLVDSLPGKYLRFHINNMFHSGIAGEHIYTAPHSLEPEHHFVSLGHKTYANMTTPDSFITLPAPAGEGLIIDHWLWRNNLWTFAGGELKRIFQ